MYYNMKPVLFFHEKPSFQVLAENKKGKEETLTSDVLLVCVGRRPHTMGLGTYWPLIGCQTHRGQVTKILVPDWASEMDKGKNLVTFYDFF